MKHLILTVLARLGKNTFKNSADFVAIKIQGALSGPFDFSLTPMYGIRRGWGKHWFGFVF